MPAPIVTLYPLQVTSVAPATPVNSDLLTVTVTENTAAVSPDTAAPITSVAELTSNSSFGGDIVNIAPGPGGVFGDAVYAISRGAGGNTSAVNRPGVIYRVNPATGQASVFFDLNTVLSQTDPVNTTPATPAANSLGNSTGLVNWYSMSFDPNGTFDGTPSLFVSSVDRSDPNKNIIFQISSSGTLIGVFVQMTDGLASQKFNLNPTAILVPPVDQQKFLSGMIAGSGISTTSGTFAALYFNASSYSPGQVISNSSLPTGVSQTNLGEPVITEILNNFGTGVATGVATGPIVGLTSSNIYYGNQTFSVFTDFGTPSGGGISAVPGFSGVQGSDGNLLINNLLSTTLAANAATDTQPAASTLFRRFYGIAFDQYGYFSQGMSVSSSSGTTAGSGTTLGITDPPTYAGSVFVSDLSSGLYVTVTPKAPFPTTPILVPVQGSGIIGVTTDSGGNVIPIITGGNSTGGTNDFGGRIIRITPAGIVNTFAYGFDTSGAVGSSSFIDSTLSIGFSADGTILYAADNSGIWQFKTTASLADSTSGSLIGLSDLRALGAPYDGLGSAVAVVDTGVDALAPSFRGRVAGGTNVITGGLGNDDLQAAGSSSATTGGTGGGGRQGGGGGSTGGGGAAGGGGGGSGAAVNAVLSTTNAGHGTPVAGIIAQFVPQATIVPVDIFSPFAPFATVSSSSGTGGTGSGGGGGGGGGGTGSTGGGIAAATNNDGATTQTLYNGINYLVTHPFVSDPVRSGVLDRMIAAVYAFGTSTTFSTEAQAYKQYPQEIIALKNLYHKLRKEGTANIAASGQFGEPLGASAASSTSTTGSGGTGSNTGGILQANNNAQNQSVGDNNGMSLPAIINEVISVTGVYSFPFIATPSTSPIDTPSGVIPRPEGPILLFGSNLTIGGTASVGSGSSGATGGTGTSTTTGFNSNAELLAAADFNIWVDRIPGAVNRSPTTDFAAPAFNTPTFSRTFSVTSSTTTTGTGSTGTNTSGIVNPLTFTQVGTSMSAAVVTGAYAVVSSALNYWTSLAQSNGYTSDGYLNTPVGTDSLNFGPTGVQECLGVEYPRRHQRNPGLDGGSGDRRQRRQHRLDSVPIAE